MSNDPICEWPQSRIDAVQPWHNVSGCPSKWCHDHNECFHGQKFAVTEDGEFPKVNTASHYS